MILGIFKGLLGLVLSIAKYIETKQLLDAGEAKANVKTLNATLKKTNKAIIARRAKFTDDELRSSNDNRD